jgi:hypothetical protein
MKSTGFEKLYNWIINTQYPRLIFGWYDADINLVLRLLQPWYEAGITSGL